MAQIGCQDSDEGNTRGDNLWELALTPVFRLAPKETSGFSPYLEAGIGGHVLSDTRIGKRELSTAWQFGSHIDVGLRFGDCGIGYRFQRLSNGSIKAPNDGISFHTLSISMRL